jgi:hypothetical protein
VDCTSVAGKESLQGRLIGVSRRKELRRKSRQALVHGDNAAIEAYDASAQLRAVTRGVGAGAKDRDPVVQCRVLSPHRRDSHRRIRPHGCRTGRYQGHEKRNDDGCSDDRQGCSYSGHSQRLPKRWERAVSDILASEECRTGATRFRTRIDSQIIGPSAHSFESAVPVGK